MPLVLSSRIRKGGLTIWTIDERLQLFVGSHEIRATIGINITWPTTSRDETTERSQKRVCGQIRHHFKVDGLDAEAYKNSDVNFENARLAQL